MVAFDSGPFKLCSTLLIFMGQWPYQKPTDYIPRRCFILFVLLSFLFVQIRTLYVSNFDRNLVLKNAQLLSLTCVGFTNLITFYIKNDECKEIFELMYTEWSEPMTEKEMKIKGNYLTISCKLIIYATVLLIITTVVSTFVPCIPLILDVVAPLNYTRPRALLYHLDLYIDEQKYFPVYMIFYYTSSTVGIIAFLANLCLLSMIICQVCGMFEALGYLLEHAFDFENMDDSRNMYYSHSDNAACRNVIICIKAHCRVERFSTVVEKWVAPIVLQNVVCAALIMSFSLAGVIDVNRINYESFVNVIFNFVFLGASMGVGQKVINISTETCYKAYNGKWYNSSVRTQKLLLTIMECYTPHSINAYKIVELSLQSAETIFRTSVSYCLLLRTF